MIKEDSTNARHLDFPLGFSLHKETQALQWRERKSPRNNDKCPADKNQRAGTNSGFMWGLCAKQLLFKQLKMTLRQCDSDRKLGADAILVVKNAGRTWRTAEPWASALKSQIKVFLEKKWKIMCTKKEMFLTLLTYNIRLGLELLSELRNTISDDTVFFLMTVSQLILTGIQRQTQCEKPSKDTKQNTHTHCDPYFFSLIKATEDWERNKEEGQILSQVQNSCIVRSDEVGQEDQQECIWQNSSKPWVLCNGMICLKRGWFVCTTLNTRTVSYQS